MSDATEPIGGQSEARRKAERGKTRRNQRRCPSAASVIQAGAPTTANPHRWEESQDDSRTVFNPACFRFPAPPHPLKCRRTKQILRPLSYICANTKITGVAAGVMSQKRKRAPAQLRRWFVLVPLETHVRSIITAGDHP